MSTAQEIKHFRSLLPVRVIARVSSTEDGLWAKISTPDGKISHCYTQASNMTELMVMMNDAIFCYLDIPDKLRKEMGFYLPLSNKHLQMEQMFNKLISMEKQLEKKGGSETTLTLREMVQ